MARLAHKLDSSEDFEPDGMTQISATLHLGLCWQNLRLDEPVELESVEWPVPEAVPKPSCEDRGSSVGRLLVVQQEFGTGCATDLGVIPATPSPADIVDIDGWSTVLGFRPYYVWMSHLPSLNYIRQEPLVSPTISTSPLSSMYFLGLKGLFALELELRAELSNFPPRASTAPVLRLHADTDGHQLALGEALRRTTTRCSLCVWELSFAFDDPQLTRIPGNQKIRKWSMSTALQPSPFPSPREGFASPSHDRISVSRRLLTHFGSFTIGVTGP
ncbi:hypothetical protein BS47DRAFT_1390776 [Hydnum rufescens UP504]|uniref:Uncharacterized protein n=1 Tax=Hydnum rufescens UP504 TaxID=1448309 RepID=A0A9P6B281_9AGAM|nr:hypothetical protein BS47DRAFT_1390776 [Hydnum rufescens UP504]